MKKLWIVIILVLSYFNANNNTVEKLIFAEPCYIPLYNLDTLKYILGVKESGNNYKAIHKVTRCMGKYQFRRQTLEMLKIYVTDEEYLNNNCLQEDSFEKLVAFEYGFLKRHNLLDYVGTNSIDNIPITVEGLIMASHLCGPVSVYDYIINKNSKTRTIKWGNQYVKVYKDDFNGTKLQSYLRFKKI